jgi:hypothetical protein
MKNDVELYFLGLFELFSILVGALIWVDRSAAAADAFQHWRFTETPYNSSR